GESSAPPSPGPSRGGQLVGLGRYSGGGHAAVTLSGQVGTEAQQFVYELSFPEKTADAREFVEHVWARRKVGYLLDQIRANGEKKELVEEVTGIAKKYGIATPYTSYLIVPDGPMPVVRRPEERGRPDVRFGGPGGGSAGAGIGGGCGGGPGGAPAALAPKPSAPPGTSATKVADFAKAASKEPGKLGDKRDEIETELLKRLPTDAPRGDANSTLRLLQ